MNKTIESLKLSIDNSIRIKEKILNNIKTQDKRNIILNLVEIDFDFKLKEVEIIYYVIDNEYPNTKVSFEKFREIIKAL